MVKMVEQEKCKTIYCRLLGMRQGDYSVYAFENLNIKEGEDQYVMCTRLPNWDTIDVKACQEGILKYQSVRAGIDTWYDPKTMTYVPYKHSANYFIDFVPTTFIIENNKVVTRETIVL